ncbi:MAG: phenylalanine--tRNA ligase subunit alpha [Alphaproteobacteria bacterium]|nr:phenylalanine--tRNA ligase subunit alpha [Alphaproteobacteria bacterium]
MGIETEARNFISEIEKLHTIQDIDVAKSKFLGKSGILTQEFKKLSALNSEEKISFGKKLNSIKNQIEEAINNQVKFVKKLELDEKLQAENVDITLPVNNEFGSLHILSYEIKRIKDEYKANGFLILDGPEVETEFFNFDALNIPKYHPARQSQDTFYIEGFPETLLRTQTSCVQIRAMQEKGLPLRMISIGKTYRNDQLDSTHSPMFHQIEGLVVDYNPINIGNLKDALNRIVAFVFEVDSDSVLLRFRPSFFPFTEPGMEVDCCYSKENGNIKINKNGNKWLELGGAGMVHPNVFKACGIDGEAYGFAFGFGLERLVMLKYGINDIRSFYDTDMRILKHYSSISNN